MQCCPTKLRLHSYQESALNIIFWKFFLYSLSSNETRHRLITIQIEQCMSSFNGLGFFFVHNNPEAEARRSYAHAALNDKTERETKLRRSGSFFYFPIMY